MRELRRDAAAVAATMDRLPAECERMVYLHLFLVLHSVLDWLTLAPVQHWERWMNVKRTRFLPIDILQWITLWKIDAGLDKNRKLNDTTIYRKLYLISRFIYRSIEIILDRWKINYWDFRSWFLISKEVNIFWNNQEQAASSSIYIAGIMKQVQSECSTVKWINP